MNKLILEAHTEFGGPNRVLVNVAVQTRPNLFEVFQRLCSDISNYDIDLAVKYGKKLEEEQAHFLFPQLKKEKGFVYDNTPVVGSTSNDKLTSVSDLYENIQNDLNSIKLNEDDKCAMNNALKRLQILRELIAPHMVKKFDTDEFRG